MWSLLEKKKTYRHNFLILITKPNVLSPSSVYCKLCRANSFAGKKSFFGLCRHSLDIHAVILSLNSCSPQGLCLEIEQTQQASDPAELQRWSQLSSRAREELGTLQCILGSMKDYQVQ